MNALTLRKQLLIAESDLNRIELAGEKHALHPGWHVLTDSATAVDAIASSAAMLASNLAAIPRRQRFAGAKTARFQSILNGAVIISSVWLALFPRKTT